MTITQLLATLCFWCSSLSAFAAVGTAVPQAWFVRPASICPMNGDGLGYECAATTGAHGAFSGLSNILWTATTGVDDGDTLYVCGAHASQLAPTGSGSLTARIKVSGDCPGDRGSINTAGGSALDSAILLLNTSHVEVSGFGLLTGNRSAILMYASNVAMTNIVITRNVIDNRTSASATNVCNGVMSDGPFGHEQLVVDYNTILGTATNCGNTSNSDAINLIRLKSGRIAWNDLSGSEGGIDLDGSVQGVDVYGNYSHDNRVDGMKVFGGHVCPIGPLRVQQNLFVNNGNWGAIWQNQRNGLFADNTIIQFRDTPQSGNAPYGGLQLEDPALFDGSACAGTNTAYLGNIITANWQYGAVTHYSITRAAFESANVWEGNLVYQNGTQTPLIWFGTPLAPTSQVNAGNYTGWQSSHKGEMNAAPQFVDAANCVSQASVAGCQASDFRLATSSPFKNDGPWWGKECVGVNGKVCVPPVRVARFPVTVAPQASYTFTGTITGPLLP